jgi:cyclohexyl-isocyanide hydratase
MPRQVQFVSVLFPGVTQLDLTGPVQVFSRLPNTAQHLVWHRLEAVPTDAGFSILPTTTLSDAPQADVLFVPGGRGAFDLLEDDVVLDFLRRQALGAQYITSVCTGSFVLAAAGLLSGRRVTTHWGSLHLLARLGAVPTPGRVVRDGNVITGAGVSSGIDFALTLASEMFGADAAKRAQLAIEYDPEPPFNAGSPHRPDADATQVADTIAEVDRHHGPLVDRAAQRLKTTR